MLKRWLDIRLRYRRLLIIIGMTTLLLTISTVGFVYIEDISPFNAFWMTIVSIMTIGYGDIYPTTQEGRWFALLLIPLGVGIITYALGVGFSFLIENQLSKKVWNRRMQKEISKLSGHIIVCGFGRVAQQVYRQLKEEERDVPVLYICDDEDALLAVVEQGTLRLIGDPTDKEMLVKARVDKARALIAALPNDADNVFITLTAKSLNEELEIAARAEREDSEEVLKRAGASRVINPTVIGGRELAMSVIKPKGTDYINDLIRSEKKELMVEEVILEANSPLVGKTVEEVDIRKTFGITLVAIMRAGKLISNPDFKEVFRNDDTLIAIGDPTGVKKLRNVLGVEVDQ
ncbi:voltage-gated potassium channel [Sporosarcina luteola]|nr:voltage-gated potassium channel [Sporosarcina luteola]